MDSIKSDDFVNVAIRIRPQTIRDDFTKGCIHQISQDPPVIQVADRSYSFDNIFTEESEQYGIYSQTVKPLVKHVIEGYNCTVFAYGQTGTGKTYTMGTDPERYGKDMGLITRALEDILNCSDENMEVFLQISFCEIYNEKTYDLLSNNKNALQLKGFNVVGLSTHKVTNVSEAERLLFEGGRQRHTGETKQNSSSSRSHAIFTIHYHVRNNNKVTKSKLNLVDLAGSESIKKTGNEGNQLFEGININKGLLCIGQVINALSSNRAHIPYRQSTITLILQDSLNKKNYVSLIACVSQNIEDIHETQQTLEFTQRAKRLKSRPELNFPKMPDSISNKFKPTPKSSNMLSSRKKLHFQTPARSVSTTALPMHSTLNMEINHGDFDKQLSLNSSIASTINEMPSDISPIIKKCLDAVESSILEKIQNIMQQSTKMTPVKPKTPKLSWHDLQNEVTKIVREEFKHLTKTNQTFRMDGNESCPDDSATVKKKAETPQGCMDFNDASPIDNANKINNSVTIFKIPEILPRHKTRYSKLKTSSPVQNKVMRRSLRLSLKQQSSPILSNDLRRSKRNSVVPIEEMSGPIPKPRTRVSQKRISRVLPIPTPRKSKSASYHKQILHIVNTGSHTDLVKLNSIGTKTASLLIRCREFRGHFSKISDIEKVPWRGNGYQRFLKENFLD